MNLEDLRQPTKAALRIAAELAFRRLELPAARGELAPENLSQSGRRHLLRLVESYGLKIASLSVDVPGLRLTDPRTADERIARTCAALELAADLKVPVVTASVEALTDSKSGDPSAATIEALRKIGENADGRGVRYALRPTVDSHDHVGRLLKALACPALGVGLDPGALVMHGVNPLGRIEQVAGHVALLHARDATAGSPDVPGLEARLTEGDVDFVGLLGVLEAADYAGPFIVRRWQSAMPMEELQDARRRMQELLERED